MLDSQIAAETPAPTTVEKTPEEIAAIEASRAEREAAEKLARIAKNEEALKLNTERLLAGMRFGCEKKITTANQFDRCIASLNTTRAALHLPALTGFEVSEFQRVQNFQELVNA
jgi:hypothetical protein